MPNQDPADTRRRILDSAAALFAKSGFSGTVTHEISHLAGVNESTLFRHFPSKLELYIATLDSILGDVRLTEDSIGQIRKASSGCTALDNALGAVTLAFEKDPLLHRLVQFGMLELPEQIQLLLRRHLYELVEQVSQHLEPWIEHGRANLRAKTIVLTFLAAVMNYRLVAEAFQADMAHPLSTFGLFTGMCSTAGPEARGWKSSSPAGFVIADGPGSKSRK
jgi:AcrR family transcriptional regulator